MLHGNGNLMAANGEPGERVETHSQLRVSVLGAMEVSHDGEFVDGPDFRRQRVRELLSYLVAHRRARREQVAEELWPHVHDSARNLRVTLSYLQRVLEPGRQRGQQPYFVLSDSTWLELRAVDNLTVDAWILDAELAWAEADRSATTMATLALWRGEPFADVPYALWAHRSRERLRSRFTAVALRTAQVWLDQGQSQDARIAAQRAVDADPWSEPAYQVLARTHLAAGDVIGARRASDAYHRVFDTLDLAATAEV